MRIKKYEFEKLLFVASRIHSWDKTPEEIAQRSMFLMSACYDSAFRDEQITEILEGLGDVQNKSPQELIELLKDYTKKKQEMEQ